MHFCVQCKNMYYLKIQTNDDGDDQNDKLVYFCRNCGDVNEELAEKNICVSKTSFNDSGNNFSAMLNEYSKYDPTLPRTTMIKCPNTSCSSNVEDGKREVIYNRYDDTNLKYVYMCCFCDTTWKTTQHKDRI